MESMDNIVLLVRLRRDQLPLQFVNAAGLMVLIELVLASFMHVPKLRRFGVLVICCLS
jgi:hypothetical protein